MSISKVVVVGDEDVGKSCLIVTHSTGVFPHDRIPIIVSILSECADENGDNRIEITFYDTFGSRDFDFVRHCLYTGTDVFLLCFSVVNHLSFQNVLSRWNHEVKSNCPRTPIILVGLQADLATRYSTSVTYSQGFSMANAIGAVGYVECSAITKTGLGDLNKLLNEIIREQPPGISNLPFDIIEVERKSSLGNWIMAAILLLIVGVVLYSRFFYKKHNNPSLPENQNNIP